MHCAVIAWQTAHCLTYVDILLQHACLLRVITSIPRPFFWYQKHMRFIHACNQPTPQLATQHLRDVPAYVCDTEKILSNFYHGWIACVAIVVSMARLECDYTPTTQQLWHHCVATFLSMVVQRLICSSLFYHLTQTNVKRGITEGILDTHTKLLEFGKNSSSLKQGDLECSICLSAYTDGENIRQLGCSHNFHCSCLDPWLVKHQNRCPLCLAVVGPAL